MELAVLYPRCTLMTIKQQHTAFEKFYTGTSLFFRRSPDYYRFLICELQIQESYNWMKLDIDTPFNQG